MGDYDNNKNNKKKKGSRQKRDSLFLFFFGERVNENCQKNIMRIHRSSTERHDKGFSPPKKSPSPSPMFIPRKTA